MTGDDYAPFRDGSKWGFRDAQGNVVVEPMFDAVGSYSEGLARVRVERLWGFIDTVGDLVIAARFEQARLFSRDQAKVKLDGRWGLIDRDGAWIEDVESQSFLDDKGHFISSRDHEAWEKPPRPDTADEE